MNNFILKLDNQYNRIIIAFGDKKKRQAGNFKSKPRAQKFLDLFEDSKDKKSVTFSKSTANPYKTFENSLFKKQNLQKPVYTSYSKNDEVKLVTIGLASANRIRQWAEKTLPNGKIIGEVTNANTLHHKTFKPQKGGLFCERIFGPLKDFQCACTNSKRLIPQKSLFSKGLVNFESSLIAGDTNQTGADSKNPNLVINNTSLGLLNNYKRFYCSKCDVEYTWSVIRRYQLGYIKLNAPVTHVWYVKGNPSYISLLLDMKKKHVEYVTYCTETLTLENSLKGDQFYTVSDSPSDIFAAWQKVIQSSPTHSGNVNPLRFASDQSVNFMQEKIEGVSLFSHNQPSVQTLKDRKSNKKNSYYLNLYSFGAKLQKNHKINMAKNIMSESDRQNNKVSENVVPKTQPQLTETIYNSNSYFLNSKLIQKYQIFFEQSTLTDINPIFEIQNVTEANNQNQNFFKYSSKSISESGVSFNNYLNRKGWTENIKTKTQKIVNRDKIEYDLDSLTKLTLIQILPFFYRESAKIFNLEAFIRFKYLFSIASKKIFNKFIYKSPKTAIKKVSFESNAFLKTKSLDNPSVSCLLLRYFIILLKIRKTELYVQSNSPSAVNSLQNIRKGVFSNKETLRNLVTYTPSASKHAIKLKENLLVKLATNLLNSTLDFQTKSQAKDTFTFVQINSDSKSINITGYDHIFNSFEIQRNLNSFYLMRLLYILKNRDFVFMEKDYKKVYAGGVNSLLKTAKNKKLVWNNLFNSFQKYFNNQTIQKKDSFISKNGVFSRKNFTLIMAHCFSGLRFKKVDQKTIGFDNKEFLVQFSLKNINQYYIFFKKDIWTYKNQNLKQSLFINKLILFIKKQLTNCSVVTQKPFAILALSPESFVGTNPKNTNLFTKSELNVLQILGHTFGLNKADGKSDKNTGFYNKYAPTAISKFNLRTLKPNKLTKQYIQYSPSVQNKKLMLLDVFSSTSKTRQTKDLSNCLSYVEAINKEIVLELGIFANTNQNKRRFQTKTIQNLVKTLRKNFVDIYNKINIFNRHNVFDNSRCTRKAEKMKVFPAYYLAKQTIPRSQTGFIYINTKTFCSGDASVEIENTFKKTENLSKEVSHLAKTFGTNIVNNIYCLSHRELWAQERDWQFFALYYFSTPNLDDLIIPIYSHRTYDFSLLNTLFTKEKNSGVYDNHGQPFLQHSKTNLSQKSVSPLAKSNALFLYKNKAIDQAKSIAWPNNNDQRSINPNMYYLNQEQEKQDLNVSFSGAGMIQTLLKEFDYFEMKKIDKQNRILLYDLNKYIRKLKKSLWSASIGNGDIFNVQNVKQKTNYSFEFGFNYTNMSKNPSYDHKTLFPGTTFKKYYTFIQKLLRETCHQRDALIRRTKLIRKVFKNANNKNLLEENMSLSNSQNTSPGRKIDQLSHDKHLLQGQSNLQAFGVSGHLTSMVLTMLPVLPPDLRPIVKMGNQIAASDLNRLYQRVIYRNDRLKKFLKDATTNGSYEMKYAQRLLQEAVDNLIQNGKSGVVPEKDARGRALKSLSDLLKGKQGRFRQYLLGKRVDYSGRSVIVVGPKLKLHECGIPKEMALELYLPFLIKSILNQNFARTIVGAKSLIQNNKPLTWSLLREIMKTCPVLLNRAPTLHRLGFQAFQPKLVDGRAILLHPLVCPAFNADFDGDQMAVHVPISAEARAEAWKLMLSRNNLLSPATGEPLVLPSQDMVLGCYYLTTNSNFRTQKYEKGYGLYFGSLNDVLRAYSQGIINTHTIVWIKWNGHLENTNDLEQPLEIRINRYGFSHLIYTKSQTILNPQTVLVSKIIKTTPGKILFNVLINSSFK